MSLYLCILDSKDPYILTDQTRELGFLVARGTTVRNFNFY